MPVAPPSDRVSGLYFTVEKILKKEDRNWLERFCPRYLNQNGSSQFRFPVCLCKKSKELEKCPAKYSGERDEVATRGGGAELARTILIQISE